MFDVAVGLMVVVTLVLLYIAARASRSPARNPFIQARRELDRGAAGRSAPQGKCNGTSSEGNKAPASQARKPG